MSVWVLALIIFNIFVALLIVMMWIRQIRPPKEDPRLSRGLQLLQSKISVLEDLSDRTETQVKQLTRILDERAKILQTKMLQAEEMILKVEKSMRKSLDVAEIFQDKIPHEEIIERNQQSKYVLAAKLANEGLSVDQIAEQVDLPHSEIEFITKVNREELVFDPELLPEWAKAKMEDEGKIQAGRGMDMDLSFVEKVFNTPSRDLTALNKVEAEFKQSVRDAEEFERREEIKVRQNQARVDSLKHTATQMTQGFFQAAKSAADQAKPLVRKVQFPRIYVDKS